MMRPGFPPRYSFHARSCAIQAYYRESKGVALRYRRNVAAVIPRKEYDSLQVRFTKALRTLAHKGLIIFGDVGGKRWTVEGREHEANRHGQELALIMGVRGKMLQAHVCCRRYRVVYCLTKAGVQVAEQLAFRWQAHDLEIPALDSIT
jgi:hypothetical protein